VVIPSWAKPAGALLVGALAVFAFAWIWRGNRDAAVIRNEQEKQQHVADSLHALYRPRLDSLAAAERASADRARLDSIANAALRREAAQHAQQDRVLDSALAVAGTLADSFRVAIRQRDEARSAYRVLAIADTAARFTAAVRLAEAQQIAETRRLADSTEFAAQLQALRRRNQDLALQVANQQRFFGLFRLKIPPIVGDLAKVGIGLYGGCRLAGGCKVP